MERNGTEWNGTEKEWNGTVIGNGIAIVPTLRVVFDVGNLPPFAYGTVRSLGVAVISRDLTRTYSGRCMECIRLGSAIEQLNRYGAFICEYKK